MKLPGRVLVIDDEPTIRRACERSLAPEGIETTAVCTCEEALGHVAAGETDAIILDLMMPGMGGLEFLRMIREQGSTLPVLVITGYSTPEIRTECRRLGAAHSIAKPFDPDQLLHALERAVSDQPRGDPDE